VFVNGQAEAFGIEPMIERDGFSFERVSHAGDYNRRMLQSRRDAEI
jgi:hypothetical protein